MSMGLADSLDRLRLASALTEALALDGDDRHDGLPAGRTFGDWMSWARERLDSSGARVGFRSSGTTGFAKAAVHALAGLEEEAGCLAGILGRRRRVLSAVPAHHLYGFLFTVLVPRQAGAVPVLDVRDRSPAALAALCRPGDLVVGYPDFWRDALRGLPVRHGGRGGVFIPTEIAWVVERSFSWISRYHRLNIIAERTKEHLVAFVQIAFISILSTRLKRLAPQEVSA